MRDFFEGCDFGTKEGRAAAFERLQTKLREDPDELSEQTLRSLRRLMELMDGLSPEVLSPELKPLNDIGPELCSISSRLGVWQELVESFARRENGAQGIYRLGGIEGLLASASGSVLAAARGLAKYVMMANLNPLPDETPTEVPPPPDGN